MSLPVRQISAKLGTNVETVLRAVVERIPPPAGSVGDPFKALVFDSNFDHYRGVVANIAVFGGQVKKGDKIVSAYLCKTYEVNELGLLRPEEHPTQKLYVPISLLINTSNPPPSPRPFFLIFCSK
ncbi:translation factor Guf1, mitochondrial-like [Fundulus heteroclitus]|uniref:translation factor Guf1, mitochondrial-like n=1 Tax=Fundulus heteroclitus TaxID=8078 RepID=UPI00165B5695|nr:translation factor Guf1, mitochondrial-like [Fundulus heteroclitus]